MSESVVSEQRLDAGPQVWVPPPLELYRRRWTAVLALIAVSPLALGGVFAVVMLPQWLERGALAASMLSGFVVFCVVGTVAKTAWRALRAKGPALMIDAVGITDVERGLDTVPWRAMARVEQDDYRRRLYVDLREPVYASALLRPRSWLRRGVSGGDVVFSLASLVYEPRVLKRTLAAYQALAMPMEPPRA